MLLRAGTNKPPMPVLLLSCIFIKKIGKDLLISCWPLWKSGIVGRIPSTTNSGGHKIMLCYCSPVYQMSMVNFGYICVDIAHYQECKCQGQVLEL